MNKKLILAALVLAIISCGDDNTTTIKDPVPQVFEIVPSVITNKAQTHILVKGADIKAGARVQLKREGGSGEVTLLEVAVESVNRISAVATAGAPAGTYEVILQNTDGQLGVKGSVLTVVDDLPPEITGVRPDTISRTVDTQIEIIGMRFPTDCADCRVAFPLETSSTRELPITDVEFVSETKIIVSVQAGGGPGYYRAEVSNAQGVKGEKAKGLFLK